jgi:hypothetical protein
VPRGAVGRSWGYRRNLPSTARGGRHTVVLGVVSRLGVGSLALNDP